MADCELSVQLQVTDTFDRPLLIGNDFLMRTDLVIDYSTKSVHKFDKRDGREFLPWKPNDLLVCGTVEVKAGHVA